MQLDVIRLSSLQFRILPTEISPELRLFLPSIILRCFLLHSSRALPMGWVTQDLEFTSNKNKLRGL
jgi:hypothetical protein